MAGIPACANASRSASRSTSKRRRVYWWKTCVERDALREALAQAGIPAMVYYPIPLHMQKAYQDPRYQTGDFPVAEKLAACVLSLPMHTDLDNEQLEYITTHVLQAIHAQH